MVQDLLSAPVRRIRLAAALFKAFLKNIKAPWRGHMSVHIPMGKVNSGPQKLLSPQVQGLLFLECLLSRRIVNAQAGKFFLNRHSASLPSISFLQHTTRNGLCPIQRPA